MIKRLIAILFLSGSVTCYASEKIVDFSDKSVDVLNEELRRLDDKAEDAAAQALTVFSAGMVMIWTTDTAPDGWLLCYGQAVSRADYAALFAVIGESFGAGDGSTTFNVPDMRGRVPVGQDDMGGSSANTVTNANADTLGGAFGEEKHTMTVSELVQHAHTIPTGTGTGSSAEITKESAGVSGNAGTANAGSSTPFNVCQPSRTVNYIIKY